MTAFRYLLGVLFQKTTAASVTTDVMTSPDTVNIKNGDFNAQESPSGTMEITIPSAIAVQEDGVEVVSASPGTNILNFAEGNSFDVTTPTSRTGKIEVPREFLPITQSVLFDDFIHSKQSDESIGELDWRYINVNTGTVVWCALDATAANPGTVRITTNATSNSDIKLCQRSTGNTSTVGLKGNIPNLRYLSGVSSVSAADSSKLQVIGYVENMDTPGAGMYFRATDTGNWYAVTNGGSETATDTGVAQATAFKRFEIRTNSTGTSTTFYIDGTLVATHTTNLPSTALKAVFYIKTTASGTKSMDIDYFFQKINNLNR